MTTTPPPVERLKSLHDWQRRGNSHAMEARPYLDGYDAGYAASQPPAVQGVPAGWKLVPIEPTERMVHAGEDVEPPRPFGKVYRAMIAAAPQLGEQND